MSQVTPNITPNTISISDKFTCCDNQYNKKIKYKLNQEAKPLMKKMVKQVTGLSKLSGASLGAPTKLFNSDITSKLKEDQFATIQNNDLVKIKSSKVGFDRDMINMNLMDKVVNKKVSRINKAANVAKEYLIKNPSKKTDNALSQLKEIAETKDNETSVKVVSQTFLDQNSLAAKRVGLTMAIYQYETYINNKANSNNNNEGEQKENYNDNRDITCKKVLSALIGLRDKLEAIANFSKNDWSEDIEFQVRDACIQAYGGLVERKDGTGLYGSKSDEFGEIMNIICMSEISKKEGGQRIVKLYDDPNNPLINNKNTYKNNKKKGSSNIKSDNENKYLSENQRDLLDRFTDLKLIKKSHNLLPKGELGGHMMLFAPIGPSKINNAFQKLINDTLLSNSDVSNKAKAYLDQNGISDDGKKRAILWNSRKGNEKVGNENLYSTENLRVLGESLSLRGYDELVIVGDKLMDDARDENKLFKAKNFNSSLNKDIKSKDKQIKVRHLTEMWKDATLKKSDEKNSYITQIAAFSELKNRGVDISFGNRSGGMDLVCLSTGIGGVVYDPLNARYQEMQYFAPHMTRIVTENSDRKEHNINETQKGDLLNKIHLVSSMSRSGKTH